MDAEALLNLAEVWHNPPDRTVSKLPRYTGPRDTPKNQRKRENCRECGAYHEVPAIHLDYMGHADVTLALIGSDPLWTWEPIAWTAEGLPHIRQIGDRFVLWGRLTVHGVSRLAVGTCSTDKSDPEKELIGDLLRNGAMRFGIGTSLWSKAEGDDELPAKQPEPKAPKAEKTAAKPNPTDDYVDAAALKLRANALDPKQKQQLLEAWPPKLIKPIPDRIPPNVAQQLRDVLNQIEAGDPPAAEGCDKCSNANQCPLSAALQADDPQCAHYPGEQ